MTSTATRQAQVSTRPVWRERLSLFSRGVRHKFLAASCLMAAIPLLVLLYVSVTYVLPHADFRWAIVAILASIALPSYQDSIRKSRRGQAKADLVELAQGLERFRSVNSTYAGYVLPFAVSPRTGTAHYNIAVAGLGVATFSLSAAPVGGQANDTCGTLTLIQTGQKSSSSGTVNECW